ncbi:MAG: hypothetical protein HW412_1150 [Bacteroidetes bacterium]|nr:hypothetical protein [Bacteroidota bacterium]
MAPPPPIPPGGGVLFYEGLFGKSPWRRTQVVRERSAKPLCGGSNPPDASSNSCRRLREKRALQTISLLSDYSHGFGRVPSSAKPRCVIGRSRENDITVPADSLGSFDRCEEKPKDIVVLSRCRGGGIGRRTGLKILRAERSVPVQVRPSVQRIEFVRAVSSVG